MEDESGVSVWWVRDCVPIGLLEDGSRIHRRFACPLARIMTTITMAGKQREWAVSKGVVCMESQRVVSMARHVCSLKCQYAPVCTSSVSGQNLDCLFSVRAWISGGGSTRDGWVT